jgi:hypothetical protein
MANLNMHLVHGGERLEYTCKETAQLIRLALKAAFPGQKFSVTTAYGSMYSATNVRWTDGPTEPEVSRITDRFTSKTFDGSDDSTHYHEQDVDGQRVQYSGWVNVSRQFSKELQAKGYARICAGLGIEPRPDGEFWNDYRDALSGGLGRNDVATETRALLHTLRPNGCRVTLKD